MAELDVIRSLLPHLDRAGGDLLIGAGEDDAAAWAEPDGTYRVASCDAAVEGIHFDLEQQAPEDVGWRALAFALGDLAAKGASPSYGLVALTIGRDWAPSVPVEMYRGLAGLAGQVGLRLVGGDTSASPGGGSLTITLLGVSPRPPLARSAVRPGWTVAVSGPLGGARLGWQRPWPRLEEGARVAAAGWCAGDISDGLVRELDKFAEAAGVGARLFLDRVPLAAGAVPLEAIACGEEVELVCCGPGATPSGCVEVGELTGDRRVVVIDGRGAELPVARRGHDHFA